MCRHSTALCPGHIGADGRITICARRATLHSGLVAHDFISILAVCPRDGAAVVHWRTAGCSCRFCRRVDAQLQAIWHKPAGCLNLCGVEEGELGAGSTNVLKVNRRVGGRIKDVDMENEQPRTGVTPVKDALHVHLTTASVGDDDCRVMTRVAFDGLDSRLLDNTCGPTVTPRIRVTHTLGEGRDQHAGCPIHTVQCQLDSKRVDAAYRGCPIIRATQTNALVARDTVVCEAVVGGRAHDIVDRH